MYPVLFNLPYFGIPITTFGLMMVLGFLAAYWITGRRMEELKLDLEQASNMLLWCMIGGVLGAKIYYAVDTTLRGENTSMVAAFLSRGGMTWYGGLIGGSLAGAIGARVHKLGITVFANAAAPGLAIGQALGRVGCFLVGDDYGKASDLPWAIAFPEGAPPVHYSVHPTQLYEAIWLLPIAALLWSRRKKSPFLFGEYMIANGIGRVIIEQWRVNEVVALGLTEPQWIGIGLVVTALAGWIYFRSNPGAPQATAA